MSVDAKEPGRTGCARARGTAPGNGSAQDPARRRLLFGMAAGTALLPALGAVARTDGLPEDDLPGPVEDRAFCVGLLRGMAEPVLSRMAKGRLQREWTPERSPSWDGQPVKVAYLEAFGRLMSGISPWLALPDGSGPEDRLRRTLRGQALESLSRSVDPGGADALMWDGHGQALVDSAYFTSALIRAPKALWEPLDAVTKRRIVEAIKRLRAVSPPYTNWLLFAAMNEAFLFSIGEQWDPMRIDLAVKKMAEWYVGDGWYADGPRFHYDYYGSYVIHPMLAQILAVLAAGRPEFNNLKPSEELVRATRRMQRYAEHLERMIGPDGAFAAIGRSLTYRTAAHQPLGYLAWRGELPASLPAAQVRSATTAAQRRIFADPSNFDGDGFLTIGFTRHQPSLGDWYTSSGSMYVAAESLLALGLPATSDYWSAPPQPWTMRLAYAGEPFRKDYYVDY